MAETRKDVAGIEKSKSEVSSDIKTLLKYEANKKNVFIAYLLLIFFGFLGVHRFYAGAITSGIVMFLLFALSLLLSFVLIGIIGFIALAIWMLVDLFLLHGLITRHNDELVSELSG